MDNLRLNDNMGDIVRHCLTMSVYRVRLPKVKTDDGKPEVHCALHLRHGIRYHRNSNGYTHVLEVNQVNGGIVEVIHAFRDLAKQNGGRKTGEIIHSEAMEDDLNEALVTTPVFSSYTLYRYYEPSRDRVCFYTAYT